MQNKLCTLPPFLILCDHWGFFIKRKLCLAAVSHDTIYGNACGKPALRVKFFSYHWCVVYLFSEGFRVKDIATILYVEYTFLKKVNQVVQRDFNSVNYPAEHAAA